MRRPVAVDLHRRKSLVTVCLPAFERNMSECFPDTTLYVSLVLLGRYFFENLSFSVSLAI